MRAAAILAACILALFAGSAPAQTPVPPERPPDTDQTPPSNNGQPDTPPYQAKVERLAELVGTLTYLRDLCVPGDGAVWRGKMQDLLTAEGSTPARRERLAGAFNRGFDSYRLTYRKCTPTAETIILRALAEGSKIAREVSTRFGT
jgi:uncharacterized protein (TIGR02301 family)